MADDPFAFRAARWAGRLPPVLAWRAAQYERRFASADGRMRLFRGVYPTREAAAASAPRNRPLGWDNPDSARRMDHERHRVVLSDYPVILWLSRLLPGAPRVADIADGVGVGFYAFRKLLDYPPALDWLVWERPAVVAHGREVAAGNGAAGLRFTTELAELGEADILLGFLHLLDDPLGFVRAAPRLPRHVLLNRLPLRDRPTAYTLETIGTAFIPYPLLNRSELLAAFAARGYAVIDSWTIPGLHCRIPLHPEESIKMYSGLYLRRDD